MGTLPIILFLLAVTCFTVSAILGVAWWSFGQGRHARTWAFGAGTAGLGWSVYFVGLLTMPDPLWFELVSCAFLVASSALLLVGCRQRAGLALDVVPVAAAVLAALVPVFVGGAVYDSAVLVDAPPLAFAGACLIGCIASLVGRRRGSLPAQRTAIILFGASAAFHVVATLVAVLLMPIHVAHSGAVFRLMLMLGLPASFIGNGFACVLLLASDLADEMRALAATDPLTGALNRRGLDQAVTPTIANCRRRGEPITLVVADLDRFKAINDRLGHATGDIVLQRFAAYVTREVRGGDLFARLGGEEFAIVLPGTACASAAEVIDRVRRGVPALCVEAIAPLALTASFGIAAIEPGECDLAPALARADRALYASKLGGRDRVTVLDEAPAAAAA